MILTTIQANGLKVKFLGNIQGEIQLNQKTVCVYKYSKRHIGNILGMTQSIKLKPSGQVESDVELTKRYSVYTATTTATTTTSTFAYGIKVYILANIQANA